MILAVPPPPELLPARLQMAWTLGFHIIIASFGVGLPLLLLFVEWRFLKTGDVLWKELARRWSRAFAVLFAVGAVSGTVLSFELGLLWPEFMQRWGAVIGLPFTIEGFAFFLEAIFVGIYLYSWDRLSPRVHWLTGWPIAVAGFFSAYFVVMANAWMNTPVGFRIEGDQIVEIDPLAAMFNPASGAQVSHMLVAAYMVTGFSVAAYYAFQLRQTPGSEYCRRAMSAGLVLGLALAPVQLGVGDWAAKMVAQTQPVKLAAMEGQFETERGAPLRIGGWPDRAQQRTPYALEIPGGLSFLAFGDPQAPVRGLNEFPESDQPPVAIVHLAFQVMVAIGLLMVAMSVWSAFGWLRWRAWPRTPVFRWLVIALGPLSVVALEAGWIVTEVGRQPWIVQGYQRTAEAVTTSPGLWTVFLATVAISLFIGVATVATLLQLARIPVRGDRHVAG